MLLHRHEHTAGYKPARYAIDHAGEVLDVVQRQDADDHIEAAGVESGILGKGVHELDASIHERSSGASEHPL